MATLDSDERVDQADDFLQTPDQEVDFNAEADWDDEFDRRIADFESGKIRGISADEVLAELREMFS